MEDRSATARDVANLIRVRVRLARQSGETTIPISSASAWLRDLEIIAMAEESSFPFPPEPIPPSDADVNYARIRARTKVETAYWETDGWKCLWIGARTERFIRNRIWFAEGVRNQGLAPETEKWMRWVRRAIEAHSIEPTPRPVRVYLRPGTRDTFIAWRDDVGYRGDIHDADVDNLVKPITDAMSVPRGDMAAASGNRYGAWDDDSQIVSLLVEKMPPYDAETSSGDDGE
jgi:hypothetical protein